ncbi:ATP-binding protein [Streptomyces sp. SBR177]
MCAYRVVQEALTNVVKHSTARAAEVAVDFLDRELRVTVRDEGGPAEASEAGSGAAASAAARAPGSGHGLIGMRERAKIWHGSLTAEARPGADSRYASVSRWSRMPPWTRTPPRAGTGAAADP